MALEKRKFARIPLVVDVAYWVNTQERGEPYEVKAVDISEQGIFLKIDLPLGIGSEVRLRFCLPESEETLCVMGTVVWSDGRPDEEGKGVRGKAICFSQYFGQCRQRLREYIETWQARACNG